METKKAYLSLLNNIMAVKLHAVFTSERVSLFDRLNSVLSLKFPLAGNKGIFEDLLNSVVRIAQDFSDNNGQKLAFAFLSRAVNIWGHPPSSDEAVNGSGAASEQVPGFERFVYEQLVPVAFKVPSASEFNVKDGQMMVVSSLCSCTHRMPVD